MTLWRSNSVVTSNRSPAGTEFAEMVALRGTGSTKRLLSVLVDYKEVVVAKGD